MAYVMTAEKFIEMAKLAAGCKTLYIKGCFGAPMNAKNKERYSNNCEYNRKRKDMIMAATADTFGFDCVNLLKGILWGWNADKNKGYGGAAYKANGVPDIGENAMIKECSDVSSDFSNIVPGEMLWKDGHAGMYIGDGFAIECTPSWKNGAQQTAVGNIGKKSGYNTRNWTKHGKLPWIDYSSVMPKPTPSPAPTPTPQPERPEDTKMRTLKVGSKGDAVKLWQEIMVLNNIKVGDPAKVVSVDGDFGQQTKAATLTFQKQAFPTAPKEWDAIVGAKTWTKGFESIK